MSLIFNIASRYLFGKKSTNVINLITGVSVLGIAIGSAALILILSVFNGFENLLSGMFNEFNPQYKIIPVDGKTMKIDSSTLQLLGEFSEIESYSKVIEEIALFEYRGIQEIGVIKGVDENFRNVVELDSFLISGKENLFDEQIDYGIVGVGLRNKLGINTNDRLNPVTVYMLLRKKKIIGGKDFTFYDIYPNSVFSVRSETDMKYIIGSLDFAQKLIGYKNEYTAIELKAKEDIDEENLRENIKQLFPFPVEIKNKFQQDEAFLKIMNIEKWVSYLIVSFTLLLVAFNLVGCLWMIVLDKRNDIAVLKTLGIYDAGIARIFITVGLMISFIGLLLGFIIALILYFVQSQYGLIGVPDGFLISAYPIKLKFSDFIIVSITVFILGLLASLLPSRKASLIPTRFNHA